MTDKSKRLTSDEDTKIPFLKSSHSIKTTHHVIRVTSSLDVSVCYSLTQSTQHTTDLNIMQKNAFIFAP
jgi:hypothetical protein